VKRASGASCLSPLSLASLSLPNPKPTAIHSSLQGMKRMGFRSGRSVPRNSGLKNDFFNNTKVNNPKTLRYDIQ
jgi:hypothetical protein